MHIGLGIGSHGLSSLMSHYQLGQPTLILVAMPIFYSAFKDGGEKVLCERGG